MMLSVTLFVAFVTTFFTLVTLNKVAPKIGLVDHPSDRKVHLKKTPLTGGLSIAIGITLTFFLTTPPIPNEHLCILAGALCMVITGAYDDLKNLTVAHRFWIQGIVASATIFGADLTIHSLGTYPVIGSLDLGYLAYPFTLFAILTGINAMNLIDGLDGLASGLSFVAFSFLCIVALMDDFFTLGLFSGIIAMALLSFLSKNMRFPWQTSAKAFLGDAGSTALGFVLACFIIRASQAPVNLIEPTTALWFFAIPLIETLSVIVRRINAGKPAFKASKDHLHHILLERYKSVSKVVAIILTTAVIINATGLFLQIYTNNAVSLLSFLALLGGYHIGLTYYIAPQVTFLEQPIANESLDTNPLKDQKAA